MPQNLRAQAESKTARAKHVIFLFMAGAQSQIDLFGTPGKHPLTNALEAIEPDELTPRQALEELYRLKKLAE